MARLLGAGPGQDEDEDEWLVVFRLDALGRDAEGPQIVVTSTAMTEYDSYDPEDEDDEDEDEKYDPEEYSYTTRFAFQIWAPDGDLIALASKEAPYSWHNWAIDIDDARDKAMWIVQKSAEDPGYWATWDGTAGFSGVAEPGPHVPDWLDVPARAVVSLRRQFHGRAREQWAIVQRVNGLRVERGAPEREEWEETGAGPFGTVADALAATPAMRRLHRDVINDFTLSPEADLDEHALAALLDLCADEGSSNPGSWDEADLTDCDWPGIGDGRWTQELSLLTRIASVNDRAITGLLNGDKCFPVLIDEDGIVPLATPAAMNLSSTGSMIGWYGGCELRLVAPGLACNWPWGDEADNFESSYFTMDFPSSGTPEEIAAALADWLTAISFEFWAARVLEPFDPAGTLTEEELDAWAEFEEHTLTLSPALNIPDGTRDLLRAALAQRSAAYRHASQSQADPRGHAAQVILASTQPDLHYGDWVRHL